MATPRMQITYWLHLSIKRYEDGVTLYDKYGEDDFLKRYFHSTNNSHAREKLKIVLQELADSMPALPKKKNDFNKNYKSERRPINPDLLSPELQNEWYNVYIRALQKQSHLHSQLEHVTGDHESQIVSNRYQLAKQIIDLQQKIYGLNQQFRHYIETGQVLNKNEKNKKTKADIDAIENPFQLLRMEANTKSNISRTKGELKKKHQEKLKRIQSRIEEIKDQYDE